jgi:uncharacterized protein YndB with AHSA1/START domain
MSTPKYKLIVTLPSDTEIKQERMFDAPRELVFRAYTDPEMLAQWWGPNGYTTRVDQLELRPGGKWRFVQHDPDGNEFAFRGEYREVLPPERLVGTFEFEGMPGHIAVEAMTLQEIDGGTKLTALMSFDTQEERDGMIESGMEQGASESLDRFEDLLMGMQAAAK